jgi:hypothetical protein
MKVRISSALCALRTINMVKGYADCSVDMSFMPTAGTMSWPRKFDAQQVNLCQFYLARKGHDT